MAAVLLFKSARALLDLDGFLLADSSSLMKKMGSRCDVCDRTKWRGPLCEKGWCIFSYVVLFLQPFARAVFAASVWLLMSASVHLALLAQIAACVFQDTRGPTVINVGIFISLGIHCS